MIGCATVAPLAGLTNVGAEGVDGGAADAVMLSAPAIEKFSSAQICAEVLLETEVVVTVKLTLLAPCGTVTVAGTMAAGWRLDSCTTLPPGGALAFIVIMHVDELPPLTVEGLSLMDVGHRSTLADGLMATGALALELP